MNPNEPDQTKKTGELPDEWWYRVYAAVIVTTVAVVAALWAFTEYFS